MLFKHIIRNIIVGIIIITCLSSLSCKRQGQSNNVAHKQAVEAIEEYGGFVILDEKGDVNCVSLVYHEDASGNRIECTEISDRVLKYLPALPETRELLIHSSQATDEAMKHIAKLKNLKSLFMWDAGELTDAGIAHLTSLVNLRNIHINDSQITDESLLYLSKLKLLEGLSLQQNNFTDKGLAYLVEMPNLKSLWIGLGKGEITDEGVHYLSKLTNLEVLDLQRTNISDTAMKDLANLKKLHKLYLNHTGISDEAVNQLKKAIPELEVNL